MKMSRDHAPVDQTGDRNAEMAPQLGSTGHLQPQHSPKIVGNRMRGRSPLFKTFSPGVPKILVVAISGGAVAELERLRSAG